MQALDDVEQEDVQGQMCEGPEEISEVLGNVHKVFTKNHLLTKVDNGAILNTTVECSGVLLSKVLGACHYKVIMSLINMHMETVKGGLQYVEIKSYMHGQLANTTFAVTSIYCSCS